MIEKTLLLSALLFASTSVATSFPLSFKSTYEGSEYVVLNGEAKIEFVRTKNYIKYSLRAKGSLLFFSVHKTYDCSVLKIEGDSLTPLEYLHTDSKESKNYVKTVFDWKNKTITTTRGNNKKTVLNNVEPPVWDPLSAQVYLMKLASEKTVGFTTDYKVIERGRLNQHRANFEKLMKYKTDFEELETLKVTSRANVGGGTVWLAKAYSWIPAAIDIDDVVIKLKSKPEILFSDSLSGAETVSEENNDLRPTC